MQPSLMLKIALLVRLLHSPTSSYLSIGGRACNRLVILDDSNLYQSTYAVSIAFHTKSGIVENLQGLEDVVTTVLFSPATSSSLKPSPLNFPQDLPFDNF